MMNENFGEEQRLQNEKLNAFIGKWRTFGNLYDNGGQEIGKVEANDIYEWLPGNYAVIHHVESKMQQLTIHGIEILGYDPSKKTYFAPFFDNQGSVGSEEVQVNGNTWIWRGENVMGVNFHRCTAVFKDDKTISVIHEKSDDNRSWRTWMELTLRRFEPD
jgi:hypothetical protein